LVENTIVAIVQINGKVKERLEVSPTITEGELTELAMAAVSRSLDGKTIRTTIVRAPKLVNIVTAE
jgi:leucyl-tRNA synthetase